MFFLHYFLFFASLSQANIVNPVVDGVKVVAQNIDGTTGVCLRNKEEKWKLTDSTDEKLIDDFMQENCNPETQDDFNYKSESSITKDDEVAVKLSSDSDEASLFKSVLPDSLTEQLTESIAEKTAEEVSGELAAKVAAETVAESNPLTEVLMNLVMCAMQGVQEAATGQNPSTDPDAARQLFDACTGPIGMIDQLIQLLAQAIQAIEKLVNADRDFIWIIQERQNTVLTALDAVEDDIHNMSVLVGEHHRAVANNVATSFRGLLDDKIDDSLYQDANILFGIDNRDRCSAIRTQVKSKVRLIRNAPRNGSFLAIAFLFTKSTPSVLSGIRFATKVSGVSGYVYDGYDFRNGNRITPYLAPQGLAQTPYIRALAVETITFYYNSDGLIKGLSVDNKPYEERAAPDFSFGDTSGEKHETILFRRDTGENKIRFGREFDSVELTYHDPFSDKAIRGLTAITFKRDNRLLTADSTSTAVKQKQFTRLYKCAGDQLKSDLAFLNDTNFSTNLGIYLHKLQRVIKNKNTIAGHLQTVQQSLLENHRQHMLSQLSRYNTEQYLKTGDTRKENQLYNLNQKVISALEKQEDEVRKNHPYLEKNHRDIPFDDGIFERGHYVFIPLGPYFAGRALNNEPVIPFRVELPLLDRRTAENIVDAKIYEHGVLNKYMTAIPKLTPVTISRDKALLTNLLAVDNYNQFFIASSENLGLVNEEAFIQYYYQPLLKRYFDPSLDRFPVLKKLISDAMNRTVKNYSALYSQLNSLGNAMALRTCATDCRLYPETTSTDKIIPRYQRVSDNDLINRYLSTEEWEHRYTEWDINTAAFDASVVTLPLSGAKIRVQQHKTFSDAHRALVYCPADAKLRPNKLFIAEEINPHLVVEEIKSFAVTPGLWWLYGAGNNSLDYIALSVCGISASVTPTSTSTGQDPVGSAWVEKNYTDIAKGMTYTILTGTCHSNAEHNPGAAFEFIQYTDGKYLTDVGDEYDSVLDLVRAHCGPDVYWEKKTPQTTLGGNAYTAEFGSGRYYSIGGYRHGVIVHEVKISCGHDSLLSGYKNTIIEEDEGGLKFNSECSSNGGPNATNSCHRTSYKQTDWTILNKDYTTTNDREIANMVDDVCGGFSQGDFTFHSTINSNRGDKKSAHSDKHTYNYAYGNSITLSNTAGEKAWKGAVNCASDAGVDPGSTHELYIILPKPLRNLIKTRLTIVSDYYLYDYFSSNSRVIVKKNTDMPTPSFASFKYETKIGVDGSNSYPHVLDIFKQHIADMASHYCGLSNWKNVLPNRSNLDDEGKFFGNRIYGFLETKEKKGEALDFSKATDLDNIRKITVTCSTNATHKPGVTRTFTSETSENREYWKLNSQTYPNAMTHYMGNKVMAEEHLAMDFCGVKPLPRPRVYPAFNRSTGKRFATVTFSIYDYSNGPHGSHNTAAVSCFDGRPGQRKTFTQRVKDVNLWTDILGRKKQRAAWYWSTTPELSDTRKTYNWRTLTYEWELSLNVMDYQASANELADAWCFNKKTYHKVKELENGKSPIYVRWQDFR